jgi:argininosuccinate lyase
VGEPSLVDTGALRLWGGRFAGGPAEALARLSVSVQFDWRLAPYDIAASRAHARVLARAGLLKAEELGRLLAALDDLEAACACGEFRPTVDDEDVHTALERGLLERLGTLGGRLRAGRSRNDQVATDLRFTCATTRAWPPAWSSWATHSSSRPPGTSTRRPGPDPPAAGTAGQLRTSCSRTSRRSCATLDRLRDWDTRAAGRHAGAGALAGSSLPLDPVQVAEELGFASAAANSMDAVADRDFVAEFLFVAALCGVHLSRLGEEVVLWTSQEFGWVELDDAFATGSSIMPQKKTRTSPSWPAARPAAHHGPVGVLTCSGPLSRTTET